MNTKKNTKKNTKTVNVYEQDEMISQYLEFHYGDEYFKVPNFPVACIDSCKPYLQDINPQRALDVGCATGRSSLELAKVFNHVDAIDFSEKLIQAAIHLQQKDIQRCILREQGELYKCREISLLALGLGDIAEKVNFMQADACQLDDTLINYDLVFAGNLIDRLYDPTLFLQSIKNRINPNGLLVIASPYTWLEEFTQRDKWLGGFKTETGENYTSLDGLKEELLSEFSLIATKDIPFVIRETSRKYQHTLSEMSIWKRDK